MSTRALRKLQQKGHSLLKNNNDDTSSEESETEVPSLQRTVNPFDLLEKEECSDNVLDDTQPNEPKQTKTNQKKKKKKAKNGQTPKKEMKNVDNEDIDACIEEVDRLLSKQGGVGAGGSTGLSIAGPSSSAEGGGGAIMRSSISIDNRHLHPENEMKRIFGARVVGTGERNVRGRPVRSTGGILVRPAPNTPPPSLHGLSMCICEETASDGSVLFSFTHSPEYRRLQAHFYQAVESMNPDNIRNLLATAPYHIDSLLQLSEIFKLQEDMRVAGQIIEKALHAFQSAFHFSFNIAKGNCRLDYKRQENRAFFVALFRHIQFLSRSACYRTGLEFCKLILSLDLENDPLGMLLQIDFYAVMCGETAFLLALFEDLNPSKNLTLLPNFAFSIPLAMWIETSKLGTSTEQADLMLQDSLLMFPGVLMPLLDKCNVNPDSKVINATFFFSKSELSQSECLEQIVTLYVARTFHCWKEPRVLQWLEKNVHAVIDLVTAKDPRIVEYAKKRKRCFQQSPRNVLRHIFLSEIPEVNINLSENLSNERIMTYDPLPPVDSINIYERDRRLAPGSNESSLFSAFFNSMLPSYEAELQQAEQAAAAGAAGGGRGGGLTDVLRSWLDLVRPLLDLEGLPPAPAVDQPPPPPPGENDEEDQEFD